MTKDERSDHNIVRGQREYVNFASNLLHYRKKHSLTQQELAEKAQVSQRQISLYESGKSIPNGETAEKLANALTVDVEQLFFRRSKDTHDYLKEKKHRAFANRPLRKVEAAVLDWADIHSVNYKKKKETEETVIAYAKNIAKVCAYRNHKIYAPSAGYDMATVIVVEHGNSELNHGSEVVFKYRDSREVGIRKVFIEEGVPDSPFLCALDENSPIPPICYDELNIQIVGKVIQTINYKP
ncbi:helix-turn-helix domain-containing protein [Vibrio alginolyticus]|nr:helix-turn-helix domain-containing protein [Vibrio alginolyticus]